MVQKGSTRMSEILTGKLRMKLFDLLNKEDYEVLNKKSGKCQIWQLSDLKAHKGQSLTSFKVPTRMPWDWLSLKLI